MPDQLRADYLSCYGHSTIETKNIDALALRGARFENAYCAAPLCGPSRISLATSTYVSEHDRRTYGSTISYCVPNLVRSIKDAGYTTALFGKNHMFHDEELTDAFDELDHILLGNSEAVGDVFKHSFSSAEIEDDNYCNITERLTDELCSFIRAKQGETPFLGWVNYQDPHPMFIAPPPYSRLFSKDDVSLPATWRTERDETKPRRIHNWRMHSEMPLCSEEDARNAIAMYMGQVRYVDDMVGRIMQTLEETGADKNTVVMFISDHGEFLGDFGVFHKLPVFYECLSHIPLIIYDPDVGARAPYKGLVEEVDVAPTLLHMLGLSIPKTMVGRSLQDDLLVGRDEGKESVLVEAGVAAPTYAQPDTHFRHRAPFKPNSFGPGAMLRKGRYKLSIYADDQGELYDLENDPHEAVNLFDDPAFGGVRSEMTEALTKRLLSVKVRDVGLDWPADEPTPTHGDPRENPLA